MPTLEQVLEQNPGKVKIAFKNFPLGNHQNAMKAAKAALAADAQGKFWEFHDLLFKNYSQLNDQLIDNIALALNLDRSGFVKEMQRPEILAHIQQDVAEAKNFGVKGTPTVFINGRFLQDRTASGFQKMIDAELAKIE